jgi:hypothetical protein
MSDVTQGADIVVQARRRTPVVSFSQKVLRFDFDISASGQTFPDGTTSLSVSGLRATVEDSHSGAASMGTISGRIYGLSKSHLASLIQLAPLFQVSTAKTVSIWGGAAPNLVQFTQGDIFTGWVEIQAPEAPYVFTVNEIAVPSLTAATPIQVQQPTPVADIMKQLATAMGKVFENNGVTTMLNSGYYAGSLADQAAAIATDTQIGWILQNGALAIWPAGASRDSVFTVSAETGMIGYPTYTQAGVAVRTIFRPDILYASVMNIVSSLQGPTGQWTIFNVSHHLDAETPGGQWSTLLEGSYSGRLLNPDAGVGT